LKTGIIALEVTWILQYALLFKFNQAGETVSAALRNHWDGLRQWLERSCHSPVLAEQTTQQQAKRKTCHVIPPYRIIAFTQSLPHIWTASRLRRLVSLLFNHFLIVLRYGVVDIRYLPVPYKWITVAQIRVTADNRRQSLRMFHSFAVASNEAPPS
jgi:hypothetical protein